MQEHAYVQVSPGSNAVSDTPARAEPDLATPVTSCCLRGGAGALFSRAAPTPCRGDARGRGAQPTPSRKRAASRPAPPREVPPSRQSRLWGHFLGHANSPPCDPSLSTLWQPQSPHSLDAPRARARHAVGDAVASAAPFYFPKSPGCVKNHGSCAFSDAKQGRRVLEFL